MGIYTAPHGLTCGGYWGMLGHEATDAAMYARWGIVRQFTPATTNLNKKFLPDSPTDWFNCSPVAGIMRRTF
jgi:hypothetical protein